MPIFEYRLEKVGGSGPSPPGAPLTPCLEAFAFFPPRLILSGVLFALDCSPDSIPLLLDLENADFETRFLLINILNYYKDHYNSPIAALK
jgi:hypothetical protein